MVRIAPKGAVDPPMQPGSAVPEMWLPQPLLAGHVAIRVANFLCHYFHSFLSRCFTFRTHHDSLYVPALSVETYCVTIVYSVHVNLTALLFHRYNYD